MATKKAAAKKAPARRAGGSTSSAGPATIEARCALCGRPVVAEVLVVTDPGQSEHDCPAAPS